MIISFWHSRETLVSITYNSSRGLEDNITLFLKRKWDHAILISPIDTHYTSPSPVMSSLAAEKSRK